MAAPMTVLAEENVLVPHVGEIVIGLIAFGLLCFVLMWKVFPKIEVVYAQRRDAIEGGIKRAEELMYAANTRPTPMPGPTAARP